MNDPAPPKSKALRKSRRRRENDAYAEVARFWTNPKTALRMGYEKPADRQAAKDINHKPRRRPRRSN